MRECKNERDVRERDRAQQRFDEVPVRHLDRADEPIRQPKASQRGWGHEHAEASRLMAPELLVVGKVSELLFDRTHALALGAGVLKLPDRVDRKFQNSMRSASADEAG